MYKIDLSIPECDYATDISDSDFSLELFDPIEALPGLDDSSSMRTVLGMDRDPTLDELEAFTKELCAMALAAASTKPKKTAGRIVTIPAKSVSVTIRIPGTVLGKIKGQAKSRGKPYQTHINRILREAAGAS